MPPQISQGIQKILHGIMRYRTDWQRNMLQHFRRVRDNPNPTAVFVTCVDSRMLPSRFTQTNVGDMFIIRNAGNMVPHSSMVSKDRVATEPAVFELACVINNIKHIVICGHSDCKAVNMLYDIHTDHADVEPTTFSPLRAWVMAHGSRSVAEFLRLEAAQFRKPVMINKLNKNEKFPAYVDVDEKYSVTDKLSMVNTLLQMENVTSYQFMRSHKGGRIHIHAFWFDIYTGDILIFSRNESTFVVVNDETLPKLEAELNSIIERTKYEDMHKNAAIKHDASGPIDLNDLVQEARRNFSTSSCAQNNCGHRHD